MTVLTEHGGWAVDDIIDAEGLLKDVEVRPANEPAVCGDGSRGGVGRTPPGS